jgi:hypothetical protein
LWGREQFGHDRRVQVEKLAGDRMFGDEMDVRTGKTLPAATLRSVSLVPLAGTRYIANVISALGADGTLLLGPSADVTGHRQTTVT